MPKFRVMMKKPNLYYVHCNGSTLCVNNLRNEEWLKEEINWWMR